MLASLCYLPDEVHNCSLYINEWSILYLFI